MIGEPKFRESSRSVWPLRRLAGLVAVALGSASCNGQEADSLPYDIESLIPPTVQQMMAVEFPADGEIHEQHRGTFVISDETEFCHTPGRVSEQLRSSAPRFDLRPGLDGIQNSPLGRKWGETLCENDGMNLVSDWVLDNNRQGQPYKLVLAVWQGDPDHGGAVWVGGVERGHGKYPEIGPGAEDLAFDRPGIEPSDEVIENVKRIKMRRRTESDMRSLSGLFVQSVLEGGRAVEGRK